MMSAYWRLFAVRGNRRERQRIANKRHWKRWIFLSLEIRLRGDRDMVVEENLIVLGADLFG
jgi:hypothetical protein